MKKEEWGLAGSEIIDQLGMIVLILGPEGSVDYINTNGAKLLGWEKYQVEGRNWFDHFIPAVQKDIVYSVFQELVKDCQETVSSYKNKVLCRSGEAITVLWQNRIILNEGRFESMVCSGVDISNEEKMERELVEINNNLKIILDKLPVGVVVIGSDGRTEYFNSAVVSISGGDGARFSNLNLLEHHKYKEIGIADKLKGVLAGKEFRADNVEYISVFGNKRTVRNFIGLPISQRGTAKILLIIEDITRYKDNEMKMREKEELMISKNNQLELLNKITVDREMVMVGLKQRIADLEKMISELKSK